MLAVFEPLKRPQNDRTDLDRPVGTEAELAAIDAGIARADAEISPAVGAHRGTAPAGDRPADRAAEKPKDGKPAKPRNSLSP